MLYCITVGNTTTTTTTIIISFKKFLIKNPASFDDTLLREKTSTEVKKLTGQPAWIKHDLSVTYIFEAGLKRNNWNTYYSLLFEYNNRTFLGDTLT